MYPTIRRLDEISNDHLIYVDIADYTLNELGDEMARAYGVVNDLILTGKDVGYWEDRGAILGGMVEQKQAEGISDAQV